MLPQPYSQLSDVALMALCCYREAEGETIFAKRMVCHVIQNRVAQPGWWGHSVHTVILKPYQFSSFNANDPNSNKWPVDGSSLETDCLAAATAVLFGGEPDSTSGATYYHDTSMG